jgi:isoleucyl-tRNA synthetase
VNPWELLDSVGADAVRWYLMVNSPPWLPTRFSKDGVTEVARKFLATLRNVASFFAVYANVDGWSPGQAPEVAVAKRPLIDQWLLSRLDGLIETVDGHLAGYDLTRGARAIQDFVLDELSNWYVRRNRRRFWKGETGPDKEAAYATLFETLRTLAGLIAPYAPFVAEEIHQKVVRPAGGGVPWAAGPLTGAGAASVTASAPDSIHFTDFPRPSGRPRDLELEKSMKAAMDIVEAGRAARNGAVLKTRQPLARLLVSRGVAEAAAAVQHLGDVIADELNVKEIELAGPERLFRIEAKPLFKTMGPAFGKDVNRVAEVIRGLSPDRAARLAAGEAVPAELDGKNITIEPAHVEIVRHPAGGLALSEQGGLVVALETALTPELVEEGVVRELVHRLQNLRKEQGLAVTDRIHVEYCASPGLEKAIRTHETMIMSETLARSLLMVAGNSETMTGWDLDGEAFQVTIRPAT